MPDDKSSSKNLFIYLLLLLGLGGVGVLYWRCRGCRQGQVESQDQRRMKREQEAQIPQFAGQCNGVGKRLLLVTLRWSVNGCTLENRDQTLTITAHTGGSVLLPCSCTDLQTTPEELRWKRPVGNTWVEMPIRSGCTLEIREPLLTITAPTGGSVLLPCSCTDRQTKPEEFSWRKYIRNTRTLKEISSESSQYRNRVQLFNDHSPGNLSLLISHLTEEDGGVLQCAVNGAHKTISLTIEEGPPKSTPSTTSKPTTTTTAKPTPSTAPKPTPSTEVVNVHTSPTTATTHSSPSADAETPPSLTFVPFALVTWILLHIIVAVVYYTSRTKGPARVHYRTADGDGVAALWRTVHNNYKTNNHCVSQHIQE
ncbi:hypothetical protein NFI96_025895, partial [Prochilodus magdalenae]